MKSLSFAKIATLVAATVAAAILAYVYLRPAAPQQAPALVYVTVEGELIIPKDIQGRVTLINFWATDCEPCLKEMPLLVDTYQRYRPLGLETIAVAMRHDMPSRVVEYTRANRLPFKVALDSNGEAARGFGGVAATPMTFIIDKHGLVVKTYMGEPDFAQLHKLLEQKLAEPA
jgi:thiol-disulfide isomerase/thioredoxin